MGHDDSINDPIKFDGREYLILFKFVENIADLWYYNSDLSESSLDHRRREEFPVIFFGVNDYERT